VQGVAYGSVFEGAVAGLGVGARTDFSGGSAELVANAPADLSSGPRDRVRTVKHSVHLSSNVRYRLCLE
jgi:hypothetical protein